MRLLVASTNAHKLRELEGLLAPCGVELVSPQDVGGLAEVDEDQPSFEGNAIKKASAGARAAAHWTLADDSGLEVERLEGAPGVRSARFAGPGADAGANNAKLVAELRGVPAEDRGARFVCVLALAKPGGDVAATFRGEARGRILETPRGTAGFGYDPLFLFCEDGHDVTGKTFAELSQEEKARVSHRGRALRELALALPEIVRARG